MDDPCSDTEGQELCVYCGEIAESDDHVPPRTIALRAGFPMKVVRACLECNTLLGPRPPWFSVVERRRTIHRILKRRYARVLNIPPWQEGEICQRGPNLQQAIRSGLNQREKARRRLSWSAASAKVRFLLVNFTRSGARRSAG